MAAFCAKCGAPLTAGAGFCGTCGTQVVEAVTPVQPVVPAPPPSPWGQPAAAPPAAAPSPWGQAAPPPPPAAAAPSPWGQPAAPAPGQPVYAAAPAKSGGGVKIVLIVLGVLFLIAVLAIGGFVWEVHRVVNKVKTAAADAGLSTTDLSSTGTITHPDACKYLSASDVGAEVGVTIVDVKSDESGCHYFAKGSASTFTMQHLAAAGGVSPSPETASTDDASTETTSLVDIKIDSGGGRTQMKLQKALIGGLGINGSANGNLDGIGDEAFVIGNNQLIARKGDVFIQIAYSNCPCTAVQIKPLAKKLVDQL